MPFDVERLLRLWTDPLGDDASARHAFRAAYTDPVTVNGTQLTADDLVARARALQAVYASPQREVLDVVEADGKVAIAFRLSGRQIGPLATSVGTLHPTGRVVSLRVIDILTLTDGRISAIWMVADELGALAAIDAVALVPSASAPA
jgi:ketosteroid isomerase-like protein